MIFASMPSRYFELENANKLKMKIQQEFLDKILRYSEKDQNDKKAIPSKNYQRDSFQMEIDRFGVKVDKVCEKLL